MTQQLIITLIVRIKIWSPFCQEEKISAAELREILQ
jgi:hypothetical protein